MKTGLGLYRRYRFVFAYFNLFLFNLRKYFLGFDIANLFLQRVDKVSLQLILRRNGATIGKNCDIEPGITFHNCKDYSRLIIGNNCHIGAASEIKNSIIMDYTNTPHHNYIGDSVIGKNCNLGSGTKIANLRLDKKNITVSFQGEKINTGMRKLGAIIGDNVQIGINATINTGTIIGNNVFIGPGAKAQGEIEDNSKIL